MNRLKKKQNFFLWGVLGLLLGILLNPAFSGAAEIEQNVFNRNGRAVGSVDIDGIPRGDLSEVSIRPEPCSIRSTKR